MSSGTGRGRGWLHLPKNVQNPGGVPCTMETLTFHFSSAQIQKYTGLMQLLEQLDVKDDGILLNHKLKAILQRWKSDTQSSDEVKESFEYLYSQCRKTSSLSKKLVLMLSSYSLIQAKIHDVKLRYMFVQHLQTDYENRKQMQTLLPIEFRNTLCMLTEFYHKARLSNGASMRVFAVPILSYLEILLESETLSDLELFTSQLYLIGSNLKEACSEKFEELLLRVRKLLMNSATLNATSRTWLLLALDVCYNRFSCLSQELYKFYLDELGDAAMANFQGVHGILRIDTAAITENLNNYRNTSPSEMALYISESNNIPQPQLETDSANHENLESATGLNNAEKIGRPILGVGARLHKNKEANTTWGEERNTTTWEDNNEPHNRHFHREQPLWTLNRENHPNTNAGTGENEHSRGYRSAPRHKKGWEHDDRFDINYD